MANKYWVGGSGNWNDINHWSTSSGGPSGIETLGTESVVNGDFATDTVWVKGVGCVISGGTLYNVNGTYTSQANVFTIGKAYKITFDISNFISNGQVSDTNGTTYMSISGNGSYSSTIVNGVGASPPYYYPTTQHLMITGTFAIDNISVKEILSIPTSTDDVFFDNLSFTGTSTVTINALANTLNMSWSGITQNVTLVNSSYNLNVYGSLILWTGLTWTFSSIGYFYMKATDNRTITTNNIIVGANRLYFDGVGGNWILMDNLSLINSRSYLVRGTLNTNNFNYSSDGIFDILAGTNTLNLSSSVLTCARFRNGNSTNFVFNAGTSTVVINSVSVNDEITGTNVFYNLTIQSTNNVCVVSLDSNQYVTNLLTLSGYNSSEKRILITSNAIGTSKTITAPNVVASNVDFRDISVPQNLASNWNFSGQTDIGDCGGNLNIIFTPSQTQYFKHTSGLANWSDQTKWFTETNGGGVQGRVPLPQDDAIFDENSFISGSTLNVDCSRLCRTWDMSNINQFVTISAVQYQYWGIYGSFIWSDFIISSYYLTMYFNLLGRGDFIIKTHSKHTGAIVIDSVGGTYTFKSGSFCNTFLMFLSGKIYLGDYIHETACVGSTTAYQCQAGVDLYANNSILKFNPPSGSLNVNFAFGSKTYNKIWFSGLHSGYFGVSSNSTFNELVIDDGREVLFAAGSTTTIGSLIAEGTSTSGITISSSISGSTFTLVKSGTGTVTVNYCNISYSAASSSFRARNSIDNGGNTGWVFNSNNNLYWIGGSGNWDDPSHWSETSGGPSGMTTEIITNAADRNLDSDTGYWNKSSGVAISGGVAHFNNVGIYQGLYKNYLLTTGKTYRIQYTVSNYVSGIASFQDGVITILTASSDGTYTTTYVPVGNINGFGFSTAAGNSTYDIDNVSIKEIVNIPNSLTDVIFDQNSFTGTSIVTINTGATCFSMIWTGLTQNVTLNNTNYDLNVYGSLVLYTGLTWNFTSNGNLYLKATDPQNITTNGITITAVNMYIDGTNGHWTLLDDITINSIFLYMYSGILNTNDKSLTTSNWRIEGSGDKVLNFGSSIITTNSFLLPTFTKLPTITLNCGTSTIYFKNFFRGGSETYYNIICDTVGNSGAYVGGFTCLNFTRYSGASALADLPIAYDFTVNGTLTLSGISSKYRLLVNSYTLGTQYTITANSVIETNVDYRDIKMSGNCLIDGFLPLPIGGLIGDSGGNSGITFTPSQTQYFKHTSGSVNWSDQTKWYSDYSPRVISGRVPLPHDDVIFDEFSFSGISTLIVDVPRIGKNIDMSLVNQSVTKILNNDVEIYGSYILGDNIIQNGNYTILLMGRNEHILNLYNNLVYGLNINSINGTYTNMNNFSQLGGFVTLNNGIFDINDYDITIRGYNQYGGLLMMGNGYIYLTRTGGSIWSITGGFILCEGSTIKTIQSYQSLSCTFNLQNGRIYNRIWISGNQSGFSHIFGNYSTTISELIIDPNINVVFTSGTINNITKKLSAIGTSISGITISSTVTGSTHTLLLTTGATVDVNYANISYSTVSGSTILARNSIDSGGNSGWVFPGSFYWIGGSGNWSDPTHWSSTSGGPSGTTISNMELIIGGDFESGLIGSNSDGSSSVSTWTLNTISPISGTQDGLLNVTVLPTGLSNRPIMTFYHSLVLSGHTVRFSFDYKVLSGYPRIYGIHDGINAVFVNIPLSTGGTYTFSYDVLYVADRSQISFYWSGLYSSLYSVQLDNISVKEVYLTPTSMTDVIFDQNSFSGTSIITIDSNVNCNTMDWTDINQSVTLSNSSYNLNVYGSLILQTGLTWNFTSTGSLYFKGSYLGNIIKTNGVTINTYGLNFDGLGSWTNMDDMYMPSTLVKSYTGTWNTNDKTITCLMIRFQVGSGSTMNCGSSTIAGLQQFWADGGPVTFNCGTSHFIFNNGGLSIPNFSFGPAYNVTIIGGGPSYYCSIWYNISILGTLTLSGISSANRMIFYSNYLGTQEKVNVNNVIASNVDFRDIYLSGSTVFDLSDISGGSGDCGGNSGITFTPSQTQYFKHTSGSVNWGDSTKWFTSSGGIVQGRVPLPQDDVYFDENSFITGSTLTVDVPRIGKTLHMLDVNKNISVYFNTNIECYGDVKISNYVLINDNIWKFNLMGNSVHIDIRTVFNMNLFLKPFSTFIFDNDYFSNKNMQNIVNWLPCSIDFNDKNITISNIYFIGIGPIYLRSGIFTLIGGEAWLYLSGIDGGTSTIIINNTNSLKVDMAILNKVIVNNTIDKNPISLNLLNTNSNGRVWINELIIYSGNTLKFDSMTETKYPYYLINKLTAMGTSNSGITITSVNSGSTHTLLLTSGATVDVNYANISYSTVSGSTITTRNSIDSGGNTNWIFPAKRYWIGGSGNWNDPSHWSSTSGGPSGTTSLGTELLYGGNFENGLICTKSDGGGSVSTWSLNTTNPISGTQDGRLIITSYALNRPAILWNISTKIVVNRIYKISFDYKVNSGTASIIQLYNGVSVIHVGALLTGSGTFTFDIEALAATDNFGMLLFGTYLCDIQIDNASIREVVSIPTDSSDVIFDQNSFSGTSTITINSDAYCNTMDWTDINQSVTLQNSSYNLNVYGSLILQTGLTINFTSIGYLYFRGTNSNNTITTNGNMSSWNIVYFDGIGGGWTNQDDWISSSSLFYLINGTWNSNDKTISTGSIGFGIGNKTWNLGSSNIIVSNNLFFHINGNGLTFNCGTSTISIFGSSGSGLYTKGETFYNVITNNISASGNPKFNSLTYPNINGYIGSFSIGEYGGTNITIYDTLNIQGISNSQRILINSHTLGLQKTIINNGNIVASNVDFRDIYLSGTTVFNLSGITGGSGDCGGNSGITFTPPQTQYFKHASGSVNWSNDIKWVTSSGGVMLGRVPLPQDTAIFDENSFSGTSVLTINVPRIGGIDMSEVDQSVTIFSTMNCEIYGSLILGENITYNSIYATILIGLGNFIINSYDRPFYTYVAILRGFYTAMSNITITHDSFNLGVGIGTGNDMVIFDLNDFNMTIVNSYWQGSSGTFYAGNGTIEFNRTDDGLTWYPANAIIYMEGSTIKINPLSGNSNIEVRIVNRILNKLWLTGNNTGYFSITTGNNTINELVIDAGKTVKFTEGTTTTINSLIAEGTSDSGITITSVTSGSTHTLVKTGTGAINVKYATISYSNASTPNVFRTRRSTNLIGNTGWVFPPEKYWIGGSGNISDIAHWSDTSGGSGITETLGPELCLNSQFTTTANWTLTSNVSINTGLGVCSFTNASGVNGVYQSVMPFGKTYKCTIQVKNYVSGSISITDGNSAYSSVITGNGIYSSVFSPVSSSIYIMTQSSNVTLDLEYISVKEVTNAPNSGTTVYFDENSFSSPSSITINSNPCYLDMDWSGIDQNINLISSSSYNLYIYGSLILYSGLTWSFNYVANYLYFKGVQTGNFIKTNGIQFGGVSHSGYYIRFDGVGGSWCNLDDMIQPIVGDVSITNGIWDTNGKTITMSSWISGLGTGGLNLGNSTFSAANGFSFLSGFLLTGGTSTVIISGDWGYANGQTFYNIIINQPGKNAGGYYGGFICKNLTRTGGNSTFNSTPLYYDIIVTDTFTINGYSPSIRTIIYSYTLGTQRKITANNVVASNVDFRDIYLSGSTIWNLSGITGGSGDAGGNNGIIFTPPQTQYWYQGTGNWSDSSKWFTQTNGVDLGRVPLPQDDMIFDQNSFSGTSSLTINILRIGRSLDMSLVNQSVTIFPSNDIEVYGSFILGTNILINTGGYKGLILLGRGNYDISMFNVSVNNMFQYSFNSVNGKYTLQSNLFFFEYFGLTSGILDLNDYNLTGGLFGYMSIGASGIAYFGNGTIEINRDYVNTAGFNNIGTIYSEGSTIKYNLITNSVNTINFSGGGQKYNKIWFSGGRIGEHYIYGNNTFNEFKIDPGKTVKFEDNSSQTVSRLISLGKPSNLINIGSISSGKTHTISSFPNDWLVDYNNISTSITAPNKYAGLSSVSTLSGYNYGWEMNYLITDLSNSTWVKLVLLSGSTSPDGNNTAFKLQDNNNSYGYKGVYMNNFPFITPNNNNMFTYSVYAKSAEYKMLYLGDAAYGRYSAIFDLTGGTVVQQLNGTAGIENVGDGWYRCYINNTNNSAPRHTFYISGMPSTGATYWIYDIQYTGTTGYGIYVWNPTFLDNTDYYSIYPDGKLRYWVGDAGDFNDTSHWSLKSNGPTGATIPTMKESVIFDRYSFTYSGQTVTINGDISISSLYMEDINQSGITISSNYNLTLYGSLYLATGMTFNVNNLYFKSSYTGNVINTNDVVLNTNDIYFDNITGIWTNGDNFTTTANIHHLNGTWSVNRIVTIKNYSLGSGIKQLLLDSSIFNVQNFDIKTNSNNYTIIAGTSKIRSTSGITMLSQNLYDVETNNFDAISPTVNNLTLSGNTWVVAGNPIITETLQINGNSSTDRFLLKSDILRTQRTIIAQNVIISNVDIIDIKGNDWNLIGTNVGDGGGNTGITFTSSTTQYWYQGSGNWSDVSKWTSRVPLLQDIAVFDQNSFISTSTLNIDMSRISNINMSSVTQQVMANDMTLYGNAYLNNITLNNLYLYGRDVSYLNISGCTINNIFINGNYINQSNMKINSFTLIDGSFELGNYVVEVNDFSVLSGNLNSDNSTIKLTPTGTTDITFNGGDKIYNNLWLSGDHSGYFNILGNNTFNEIKIDAGKKIKFESNSTQKISSLITFGTVDSGITISSTSTSQHNLILTLNKSYLVFNYLDISYSNISPTNRFYAINSINNGNNTGWVFTSPPLYVWIQDNNGILIDDDGKILW